MSKSPFPLRRTRFATHSHTHTLSLGGAWKPVLGCIKNTSLKKLKNFHCFCEAQILKKKMLGVKILKQYGRAYTTPAKIFFKETKTCKRSISSPSVKIQKQNLPFSLMSRCKLWFLTKRSSFTVFTLLPSITTPGTTIESRLV